MVLMFGPDPVVKGGVSKLVQNLFKSGIADEGEVIYVSTQIDTNNFMKLCYAVKAVFKTLFLLLRYPQIKLFHIHLAADASFYRKSLFYCIGRIAGKKIVLHMHSGFFLDFFHRSPRLVRNLIAYEFEMADHVIFLSNQERESFLKLMPGLRSSSVISNGAFLPEHAKDSCSGRKELTLTLIGTICENKGIYVLIEAVRSICSQMGDFKVILAGSGEIDKVRSILKGKNLADKFDLRGWIGEKQKKDILSSTDIYLQPSYKEAMPMAIIEALSYGIPVVASNVGGIPEMIVNGENGFLIKPGDVKALSKHILFLSQNHAERVRMGERAYSLAAEKFNIQRTVREIRHIYDRLMLA